MSKNSEEAQFALPSFAGAPWCRRAYKSTVEDLHYQIDDLYTYLSPGVEEKTMRESAFHRINCILSWVFPGAKVSLYGSVASGMFLPNSDLDITVEWPNKRGIPDLQTVAQIFQLTGLYSNVIIIEKAAVPLVKLIEVATNVHIDLSFNVHSFYAVFRWISNMRRDCKYLDPLVLVLKQFLHVNSMNCPFNGGITSYALVVMVSHFLKTVDLSELPQRLQDSPLGALLIMFLDFYGHTFDYKTCALAFSNSNEPLIMTKSQLALKGNSFTCPSLLTIVDPVNLENDLGRGAYNMYTVKTSFLAARNVLLSFIRSLDNESGFDPTDKFCAPPVLSLIFPIRPTDIIERNVALRNFMVFNTAFSPQRV